MEKEGSRKVKEGEEESASSCLLVDLLRERQAHLDNEALIDVLLGDVEVEVRTLDEPEEKLVDDLQVRPSELELKGGTERKRAEMAEKSAYVASAV